MVMVYCSTLHVVGASPLSEIGVGGGIERRRHRRLQPGACLGQRLADADREALPIGDRAIAEPRAQGLLELALEEALLDDRLQRSGKVLDAHG
jgi:hypothetical protein